MDLHSILGLATPAPDAIPHFIREVQDIRGVRVIRLQGPVGKEIGAQEAAMDKMTARSGDAFTRPLLFDFKDATECDSVTVAYLVQALRRRMAAHARVGIINPSAQLSAELEITRLNSLFQVFPSEDRAIAELAAPAPPR